VSVVGEYDNIMNLW